MPAKGLFTQGVVVLFNRQLKLGDITPLLAEFRVLKTVEEATPMSGPAVVIEFDKESSGMAIVDLTNDEWPDTMGSSQENADIIAAWSMGHYGPFAHSGGLTRATDNATHWEQASDELARQMAFARIKITYSLGCESADPIVQEKCDPRGELDYLISIVQALLKHPSAIGYFNPNGEVLMNTQQLQESLTYHREQQLAPLEVWSKIRAYHIDESWTLMDCVGNEQLDLPDHETGFNRHEISMDEMAAFVRNATMHMLTDPDDVIRDGDTSHGPGDMPWEGYRATDPLSDPPRRVIRWLPANAKELPEMLLDGIKKKR